VPALVPRNRNGCRESSLILGAVSREVRIERLRLFPLPAQAATALPDDRDRAAAVIGAALPPIWPAPPLVGILARHAALPAEERRWGVWLMVVEEPDGERAIGDIGFKGPPSAGGVVEIGYSVVADRRRRGYASEAAEALVGWALSQPGVIAVIARCEAGNRGSVGTLRRAGFSEIGCDPDGLLAWRRDG
jgi:[ribosomal protein S5]-alanine N-acetyltransferase